MAGMVLCIALADPFIERLRVLFGSTAIVTAPNVSAIVVAGASTLPAVLVVDLTAGADEAPGWFSTLHQSPLGRLPAVFLVDDRRPANLEAWGGPFHVLKMPVSEGSLTDALMAYVPVARRVLVAEDEPDVAKLLTRRLTGAGWTVLEAADGQQALAIARAQRPTLIILDVMMPGMDGFQVARLLKFDDQYRAIPIIMLTARAGMQDEALGKACGVSAYVRKPYQAEELLALIERLAPAQRT